MKKLSPSEVYFLDSRRVGRLATVSLNGTPQVTPVCYAVMNSSLYIRAGKGTQKAKNITHSPKVALVIDDYDEDWSRMKGMMIVGTASVLDGGDEYRRARDALVAKYSQYRKSYPIIEGEVSILKVDVDRQNFWDYSKTP